MCERGTEFLVQLNRPRPVSQRTAVMVDEGVLYEAGIQMINKSVPGIINDWITKAAQRIEMEYGFKQRDSDTVGAERVAAIIAVHAKISSPRALSLPANSSLALVASLASVALDAALQKQAYTPEPIVELARRLAQRLQPAPVTDDSPARVIDPGTTGLLSAALAPEVDRQTIESIAKEADKLVADLTFPLEKQDPATLLKLRDFAVRLSAAAQHESSQ